MRDFGPAQGCGEFPGGLQAFPQVITMKVKLALPAALIIAPLCAFGGEQQSTVVPPPPSIPAKWLMPGYAPRLESVTPDLTIPSGRFGLGEFVVSALANNPRTQTSWERACQQAAVVRQAKATYYPVLDLGASVQGTWIDDRAKTGTRLEGTSNTVGGVNTSLVSPTAPTFSVFATLSWLLFDFGAREAGVDTEKKALVSQSFFYDRTLQTIVRDVELAYLRWDAARASLIVQDRLVANARKGVNTFKERVDAGLSAKVDLLQVQQLLQQTLVERENRYLVLRQRHAQLLQTAGIPANMELDIKRGDEEGIPKSLAVSSLTQLVEQALRARADLAAAIALADSREAAWRRARRDVWPKLSLFASGEGVTSETRTKFDQSTGRILSKGTSRSQRDLWDGTVGIQATVNIFDGFAKYGRIDQAASAYREARANARDVWLTTAREVAESLYALRSFTEQRDLTATLVSISQENYDAINSAYAEGVKSVLDVIDAIDNLGQAELAKVDADYGVLLSSVELAYAIGLVEIDEWEARQRALHGGRDYK